MNEDRIFDWDEDKRLANIEKHRIDFRDITAAFDDENAHHIPDVRNNYGENRVIMVALNTGVILTIVYTLRGEKTRIISARRANEKERQLYAKA